MRQITKFKTSIFITIKSNKKMKLTNCNIKVCWKLQFCNKRKKIMIDV